MPVFDCQGGFVYGSLEEALMLPKESVSLEVSTENIMSVDVPVLDYKTKNDASGDIFPYGLSLPLGT